MTESIGKLGTVCIITSGLSIDKQGNRTYPADKQYKIGSPTKKTLLSSNGYVKLTQAVKSNLTALYNCLQWIGSQPEQMRLFRIGSDLLPRFDDPECNHLYDDELLQIIDTLLSRCRRVIESHGIRVCTHPDKKAAVLNSDKESVRLNAIRCLEYHTYFMSRLQTPDQGAVINIHIHGRLDHFPEWDQLSPLCKQYLSLENDELPSAGLLPTLRMCERYGVKMIYDIHHNYCENHGDDVLDFNSLEFDRILRTWGSVRPLMHISDSRDPEGVTHKTLSPHSEYIVSKWLHERCAHMLCVADVEVESKAKQLAVKQLLTDVQDYL